MSTTTGAGLEGVIAGESEICYIDGYEGVLSYRGYNIHTLADHASFEEVVYLLWNGRLPKRDELAALKSELAANRAVPQPVRRPQNVQVSFGGGGCKRTLLPDLRLELSAHGGTIVVTTNSVKRIV